MSVRIILFRHGETDWNKNNKLQGRANTPLNKNGIKQIKKTAVKLEKSNENPNIIISSPLVRAIQSASIISLELGISIIVDKRLSERDFGFLEGKTWEEFIKLCGQNLKELKELDRKQQYDYRKHGGESAEQVGKRILDFIDYITEEYENKTIVVVTHAGILRYLSFIFHEMGMDFSHTMKPGEYCIIEL